MTAGGAEQRERLFDAIIAVASELDLDAVLERIVEVATDLVDAEFGALGVLDRSGERLARFITVGIDDAGRRAIGHEPQGLGVLGVLIARPEVVRLSDVRAHPESHGFPPNHPPMRSFLGVPVRVRDQVFGNLYLTEKRGGGDFADDDERVVVVLAAAAGTAIENARLHARVGDLARLEDRERIARDLHDSVIQRLFATGLSLQSTANLIDDEPTHERINRAIEDLDDTIREIRSAIFELQRVPAERLRDRVHDLATELRPLLGHRPRVLVDGPVDSLADADLADDVLATVREGLANVIRHAQARSVEVRLEVTGDPPELAVQVVDDGGGPVEGSEGGGLGLANLAARAGARGGRSTLQRNDSGGSTLTWSVPVSG